MTVWVTKYILENGLLEWEAESQTGMDAVWASGKRCPEQRIAERQLLQPGEWHRTREAAVERAKEMADDEIYSLERRIRELVAMTFEAEE